MGNDRMTIDTFVAFYYSSQRIQKIVEPWRVESDGVIEILIKHFREMGIFFVERNQIDLMIENMIHHLRHSPDISKVVSRAKREEMMRRRSRHAD